MIGVENLPNVFRHSSINPSWPFNLFPAWLRILFALAVSVVCGGGCYSTAWQGMGIEDQFGALWVRISRCRDSRNARGCFRILRCARELAKLPLVFAKTSDDR